MIASTLILWSLLLPLSAALQIRGTDGVSGAISGELRGSAPPCA